MEEFLQRVMNRFAENLAKEIFDHMERFNREEWQRATFRQFISRARYD